MAEAARKIWLPEDDGPRVVVPELRLVRGGSRAERRSARGLGRRHATRRTSISQGGGIRPVYAIAGWDTANDRRYSGANNGVPLGGTSMSWLMLCRISAVPSGTESPWGHFGGISGATGGTGIWNSAASLRYSIANGGGTVSTSPTRNWVTGDIGIIHGIVGTYDGATVRMYFDRAQTGSGTAATGYTAPAAGLRTSIGAGDNNGTDSFGSGSYEIIGVAFTDAVMSLANVEAWCDACKAEGDIALPGVGSSPLRWRASDNRGIDATWLDTVTSESLTRRGTGLTLTTISVPVWGW